MNEHLARPPAKRGQRRSRQRLAHEDYDCMRICDVLDQPVLMGTNLNILRSTENKNIMLKFEWIGNFLASRQAFRFFARKDCPRSENKIVSLLWLVREHHLLFVAPRGKLHSTGA